MNKSNVKKNKFVFFCFRQDSDMTAGERYRCLRRSLLVIMLLITLIPLDHHGGSELFPSTSACCRKRPTTTPAGVRKPRQNHWKPISRNFRPPS